MIDEEATFEKFGYNVRDLAPKSNKKIIAVCDDCGKIREVCKTKVNFNRKYWEIKIKKKLKNKLNGWYI
ncbi:MAG: hypothetical protein IMF19_12095 [Proteobacteria bacterium]|nr:hypothetical protein [Pseudomonadota bacterium]